MTTKKKVLLIAGIVLLVAAVAVLLGLLLPSCGQHNEEPAPKQDDITYTVEIKNSSQQPLADIGVYIYEDDTLTELVWYDTTDANGQMTFTCYTTGDYVAVLANVPASYIAEDYYPITGELTQIVLRAGTIEALGDEVITFSLGDQMLDFTIVDTDGVEHTLSEILKTKKAVMLNFWFIECQPCNLEFAYMVEAYEKYSDDIEILAMNPVNTDEAAIAAFKEQMGLTFPVAMVDPMWADMMKVLAYPTTVIIDRFGNISLVHTGMIEDTKTFEQVFKYFASVDYESNAVTNIEHILVEEETGTEDNPADKAGDRNFDVTIKPGESYFFELYKLTTKTYLTVKGDGTFTVTCNDKEYKSSNGTVTVTIVPESTYSIIKVQITNTSDEEQGYTITMTNPKGSYSNPYKMKLGEFTATTKTGDEQGTYYTYIAEKTGILTLKCKSASVKKYGFYLYNLDSYAMWNTDETGPTDEDGYHYVSVEAKKGQKIQFCVAVTRDDNNKISAGTFVFEAVMKEDASVGEEEEQYTPAELTYTVRVQDTAGVDIPNVTVHFQASLSVTNPDDETDVYTQQIDQYVTTDENGRAQVTGLPGCVTATVRVPEGYTLNNTEYTLTEEEPDVVVNLAPVVYADYTVTVTYPNGEPVEDMIVLVGSGIDFTDANGKTSFHLVEDDYSAIVLKAPNRYVCSQDSYAFGNDTDITVALSYVQGADASVPIVLDGDITFTTCTLEPGETEYYQVHDVAGSTLRIQDPDAKIIIDGVEYTADEEGVVYAPVAGDADPVAVAVVNNGTSAKAFGARFTGFASGTIRNPAAIRAITRFSIDIDAGAEDGYYCTWTPSGSGTLTLTLRNSSDTNCDVIVTWGEHIAKMSDSEAGNTLTIEVEKDIPILIQGIAQQNEDGTYPAVEIDISGRLTTAATYIYSVTVVDTQNAPQEDVQVRFVKDGTTVKTATTDENGVATAEMMAGSYTVSFTDSAIVCDTSGVVLTETAPEATLSITRQEIAVDEGMTRYTVTIEDYLGNDVGNVLVLYTQDGVISGYTLLPEDSNTATVDLTSGSYDITLYFLGDVAYYYEETTAKLTEAAPDLTVLVAEPLNTEGESHYYFGTLQSVPVGGTYLDTQTNALSFYSCLPTEQGVYYISVTDPDAVISYWGQSSFVPGELSETLEGYTTSGFSVSINTNALGRDIVVGITGTEDTILSIVRTGDAVEDIPYATYVPEVAPTQVSLGSGLKFTNVDLTRDTDDYTLVFNTGDGYYHLGSETGPVMYIQLTFNNEDPDAAVAPNYIHLYEMVGGIGNTGTGFKGTYIDEEGNEVREDYTQAMLDFGANADPVYGVYPLTEDLAYIIQMGGIYQGWWDADNTKGNLLFTNDDGSLNEDINLELAWLFAGCYIED